MTPARPGSKALFAEPADPKAVEEGDVLMPRFDAGGLVTAIVTDASSGALLMVAHMDCTALDLTIGTRIAHYHSRSRNRLWKKGETSGALQRVREIRVDCDQDAVWLIVDVQKPEETCHTHRETCFYRRIDLDGDGRSLIVDRAHRTEADA